MWTPNSAHIKWAVRIIRSLSVIYEYNATNFSGSTSGKEPACQYRRCKRHRFDAWGRKIPWRRKWHPTPVLLPGKFHGPKNLTGYSTWGLHELDTTEILSIHVTCCIIYNTWYVIYIYTWNLYIYTHINFKCFSILI